MCEIDLYYMGKNNGNPDLVCEKHSLSHDVTPGSDITPCNKIDKPLVVYIFNNFV